MLPAGTARRVKAQLGIELDVLVLVEGHDLDRGPVRIRPYRDRALQEMQLGRRLSRHGVPRMPADNPHDNDRQRAKGGLTRHELPSRTAAYRKKARAKGALAHRVEPDSMSRDR